MALLLKSRESRKGRVLAVINTTGEPQKVAIPDLAELLGKPRRELERPDAGYYPAEIRARPFYGSESCQFYLLSLVI